MGSLLNFIFEKTWGQGNGPKGCCSKGPISNEIILKHNHSRTEYFEYKEGYKNLIVAPKNHPKTAKMSDFEPFMMVFTFSYFPLIFSNLSAIPFPSLSSYFSYQGITLRIPPPLQNDCPGFEGGVF